MEIISVTVAFGGNDFESAAICPFYRAPDLHTKTLIRSVILIKMKTVLDHIYKYLTFSPISASVRRCATASALVVVHRAPPAPQQPQPRTARTAHAPPRTVVVVVRRFFVIARLLIIARPLLVLLHTTIHPRPTPGGQTAALVAAAAAPPR